ncbi:iron ABC transporter permease [Streptomyces qinzhouensis]|uniref:Iron ABC transporter permease n=1 Tax=Streptomyces qinzhouensis TaxID=2599401 RepID=A0A5B8JTD0_9ACTN|nr:iron ABC transporter permease [Streptomyces qinzhouensis]
MPFRLAVPPVSGVLRPRQVAVSAGLAAAAFAVFCWGMTIGDLPIAVGDVVRALFGHGDPGNQLIVRELRLPRALAGLLVGGAFGVAGALFQTLTRNPLASPDMIGITQGAGAAVVAGLVLGIGGGLGTQLLGLLGGFGAAALVYLLAWRRGATGYRIILVGLGVAWICTSVTDFLMARGARQEAQSALGWLLGNLNGRDWPQIIPLLWALAVLLPAALLLGRQLRDLQLGDDVARGLGIRVQWVRVATLLTGVGLAAFGAAAAGPVAFVALAAPQIAQRLARTAWPPLIASGLAGALMVLVSDLIARTLIHDTELPVGVVTGVLGAPVLLWLLVRANRAGSGG